MEWHGHLGMHMYVLVHLLNCFACLVCLLSSLLTHSPLNLRLILLKSPGSRTRTFFSHFVPPNYGSKTFISLAIVAMYQRQCTVYHYCYIFKSISLPTTFRAVESLVKMKNYSFKNLLINFLSLSLSLSLSGSDFLHGN